MVIRCRNSNKDRQCNCQVKKSKKKAIVDKILHRKLNPLITRGEHRYCGRVSSYWATSGCVQVMIVIQ